MGSRNGAGLSVTGRPKPSPPERSDPELEALVREIIGRVADKWTMLSWRRWRSMAACASRGWENSSEV
jgi:hypothetical protein